MLRNQNKPTQGSSCSHYVQCLKPIKGTSNIASCGRNVWFREYTLVEWTMEKKTRSRHLVLWSRNHKYSAFIWKDCSYYQTMGSKFRYGLGKVLGTQNRPSRGLVFTHCVLHLNPIKGTFNIASYGATCGLESTPQLSGPGQRKQGVVT